jgi:hypothetical protein
VEDGDCLKLLKALPGLKQASRAWHADLVGTFAEVNVMPSKADPCLFIAPGPLMVCLSTDDMLAIGPRDVVDKFKRHIGAKYKTTVDDHARWYLQIKIERDRRRRTISLSQGAYVDTVLARFGMQNSKPIATPATNWDYDESAQTVEVPMREFVGSTLYLARVTRPDIAYAVTKCASYVDKPTAEVWMAAKRVLRYLSGTRHYVLKLGGTVLGLIGFNDADYAGCRRTRRSRTGYLNTLGEFPVSWGSKMQKCVATSTAEAEYMSACENTKEVTWLRGLLRELKIQDEKPTPIKEDNQACIFIAENVGGDTKRSKHIDIRYHYVREKIMDGTIVFDYCPTDEMLADILTKPLPKPKHERIVSKILDTNTTTATDTTSTTTE